MDKGKEKKREVVKDKCEQGKEVLIAKEGVRGRRRKRRKEVRGLG